MYSFSYVLLSRYFRRKTKSWTERTKLLLWCRLRGHLLLPVEQWRVCDFFRLSSVVCVGRGWVKKLSGWWKGVWKTWALSTRWRPLPGCGASCFCSCSGGSSRASSRRFVTIIKCRSASCWSHATFASSSFVVSGRGSPWLEGEGGVLQMVMTIGGGIVVDDEVMHDRIVGGSSNSAAVCASLSHLFSPLKTICSSQFFAVGRHAGRNGSSSIQPQKRWRETKPLHCCSDAGWATRKNATRYTAAMLQGLELDDRYKGAGALSKTSLRLNQTPPLAPGKA